MTERLYKLPEGWRWVQLEEVCEVWDRLRKPVKKKERIPGDTPYCGANGVIDYVKGYTHEGEFVLLAEDGGFYGPGEPSAYIMQGRFWANNHVHIIRGKTGLLLNALLRSYLVAADLRPFLTGATRPKLTQGAMISIPVPLPPLAEQRRIVARIEELMGRVREARRLREQAREDTERLWQSVLADTFPRPGSELPSGWRWVRLGEVFEVQQGASMSPKRRLGRNPKPFLRTRNILWGAVDTSLVDEMDFTDEETEKLRLQPGDLLVCEGGDVGRTAIWEGQLPTASYQNHIHRLRAKDDSVEPRFIMYWMQAAYQVFLAYQGAESRTAIPNLSGRRLKEFLAPLPPLSEQRRIVARLEAVQEKIRALKSVQAETDEELNRLEQAVLDKAFRGEL